MFYSDPDVLAEKKMKEIKKGKDDSKENYDFSDIERNSPDGFLLGASIGSMPDTPSFEPDFCSIGLLPTPMQEVKEPVGILPAVSLEKLDINSPDSAVIEKDNEVSSCVVCDKKFKSKSCMNKHLRSVHAGGYSYSMFKCFVDFQSKFWFSQCEF